MKTLTKTPYEKISDGSGNTFHPNATQIRLHKAGWRVYSRKKMGCVWIIKWYSSNIDDNNGIYPQGVALEILKNQIAWKKKQQVH